MGKLQPSFPYRITCLTSLCCRAGCRLQAPASSNRRPSVAEGCQVQSGPVHEDDWQIKVSFLDLATTGYAIFRLFGALKIHGSVEKGSEWQRASFCAHLLLKYLVQVSRECRFSQTQL